MRASFEPEDADGLVVHFAVDGWRWSAVPYTRRRPLASDEMLLDMTLNGPVNPADFERTELWRIARPVLEARGINNEPLETYAAGTRGSTSGNRLG